MSEAELLGRARAIAGLSLGQLADLVDVPVPRDSRDAKGFGGQLVERALGGSAGNLSEPDFQALGIELKTVPIDSKGAPAEATFVVTLDPRELITERFEQSRVLHKLRHVLFIPIEGQRSLIPAIRRIGSPVLYSPTKPHLEKLSRDYEDLARRCLLEGPEGLDGELGEWLCVRPKSAKGDAFYLRPKLTALILGTTLFDLPA
ncbi:MAG: DNA mismatch repair protein MutH [Deltaproteobacteria bacterium]|nr:DNA mismatch repair protein MutH [Deltaproteobacteria bacterium]